MSISHTPGPVERLERATWDSRVLASKSDIGVLIEDNAFLLATLEIIASSARGSGPYARDRDADTLAMIERAANAAISKSTSRQPEGER